MAARSKAKGNLFAGIVLDQPTYRGYMYKQSHTHKSFNKRFLILYPKILIYYDTEQDYLRDLERKTLEHRDQGYRLEGLYLSKPEKKPHGAKFCFVLHCPHPYNDRKELLLVAENRESRRIWMDKLQQQNSALLEASASKHSTGSTLEVPKQRIRADSTYGLDQAGVDDETQNLDVREGDSDTES